MNYGFLVSDFLIIKDHIHVVANVPHASDSSLFARTALLAKTLVQVIAHSIYR